VPALTDCCSPIRRSMRVLSFSRMAFARAPAVRQEALADVLTGMWEWGAKISKIMDCHRAFLPGNSLALGFAGPGIRRIV
jgi:hypothetical protein